MISEAELELSRLNASIANIRMQYRDKENQVKGLRDALNALPDENASLNFPFRSGTNTFRVFDFLSRSNEPMHVSEIVKGIGLEPNQKNIQSIASTLHSYSKRDHVFSRTQPNTFSLKTASTWKQTPYGPVFCSAKQVAEDEEPIIVRR